MKNNLKLWINCFLVLCWMVIFALGIDNENKSADPLFYPFVLLPVVLLIMSLVSAKSRTRYSYLFLIISILMILFSLFFIL